MPAVSGRVAVANQVANNRYDLAPNRVSNLYAWFRSDLGVSLNGSTVSAWADQSGNGRNLTQSTASKQPTYNAGDVQYNNYPSLTFASASQTVMTNSSFTWTTFTVIIVCKATASGYFFRRGASPNLDAYYTNLGGELFCRRTGPLTSSKNLSGTQVGTTPKTFRMEMKGTHVSHRFLANGVANSTTDTASISDPGTASTGSGLFCLFSDNASDWTSGTIAEVIVFTPHITEADAVAVEKYLQLRYLHY